MSDSQGYERMTVASDGVTVTKRFEEDEFPVPAIAFEFSSDRDETVTVRLSDRVPENVAVEDLGFHPEYGSEYWTIDEKTITFERDLEPNAEYTTVYGIRATGTDDVEQFLTEPVIEEVDPPLPDAASPATDGNDIIPGSDDDVVKDVIAGEGEVPGLEDEDDEEEIETLDLTDPNAPDEETTDDAGGSAATGDGSVIAAMANEIRTNEVPVDDLKLLQRAFDELADRTDGSDGTTEARIQQLQSDIADLRAYTDALEEFLDENGTTQQLLEDFDQQLQGFGSDLEEIQSELEANSTAVSEMDETIESVRSEMDEVTEDVDGIRTEVESVGVDVEEVSEDVEEVSEDVEEVSGSLEEVESTVRDFDDTIEDLQDRVDDLESELPEGDAMERVEEVESDIENLKEWQDQIKQTFGG